MNKPGIIIVGGGAAGLMAAKTLSGLFQVTLIEHRHQLGGRIRSVDTGRKIIESGAEFMHGNLPLTTGLLKAAGLHYVEDTGRMLRKEGSELKEQSWMTEGWETFFQKIGLETKDLALDDFLEKHFADEKYEELRNDVRQYAMGFDVADPKDASTIALYKEWSNEETNYRIEEGYGAMIAFMEKQCRTCGCEIVMGQTVKNVNWKNGKVTVSTKSGKLYESEKILITAPVGVLSDVSGSCSLQFSPPIHDYINASKQIGFGPVIKVIIEFKKPIWKPDTGFIFSKETIPTWWTALPVAGNILTGWTGGAMAESIAHNNDEKLREIALESLARIFELQVTELRSSIEQIHIFNWKKYPETRGAYSYSTIESDQARLKLNTPIDATIYFAGEGIYLGRHSGTVEAALESAMMAAERITGSQSQA